ncbi:tetraspanin-18B-like isoform X2 [Clavelina lepadiformis]
MIVVGGIISLIAFLGCYGAYSENKAFLGVFFIVLVVIVLLEIAMLVVAFEFYVDIAIYIAPTAVNSIKELYGQSPVTASAATASWNTLQATLDCCGFYNGSDYNSSLFDVMMNTNVQPWPESCCILASGSQQFVNLTSCTNTEPPNTQHTNAKTGCVVALYRILRNYCGVIGGVSAAILVVEIFAMIPACWMFRKSDTYV